MSKAGEDKPLASPPHSCFDKLSTNGVGGISTDGTKGVSTVGAGNVRPNKADSICQQCGACCAAFRVDFHPAELAGGAYAWGAGVPAELTVPLTTSLVRMRGTDASGEGESRCVALAGEVGVAVSCTIYHERPGPCREFNPLAEFGITDDACARARQRHGLPPLSSSSSLPGES